MSEFNHPETKTLVCIGGSRDGKIVPFNARWRQVQFARPASPPMVYHGWQSLLNASPLAISVDVYEVQKIDIRWLNSTSFVGEFLRHESLKPIEAQRMFLHRAFEKMKDFMAEGQI